MMKTRKPKRYAEGGDVMATAAKKPELFYTAPDAGYQPGISKEHMYFQPKKVDPAAAAAEAANAANAASAAASAAPVQSAPIDINANTSASGSESGGNAKGGVIKLKKMAKGGVVKSSRGDGCAMKGKTKGRMV
jgi:hypothetical protein